MRIYQLTYILINIILCILLTASSAGANVVIFKKTPYEAPAIFPIEYYRSYISHSGETQNMLISLTLKGDFEKNQAVWIFPLPGGTSEIKVDKLKSFPEFEGKFFNKELESVSREYYNLYFLSQIFLFPINFLAGKGPNISTLFYLYSSTEPEEIRKAQKYDLMVELVPAEPKSEFIEYAARHKLDFPIELNKAIDEYLGKNYTFVVSRLSRPAGSAADNKYSAELRVSFKTPHIYIPLKLYSAYINTKITMHNYIAGFVDREGISGIDKLLFDIDYMLKYNKPEGEELSGFFNAVEEDNKFKFTDFYLSRNGGLITDDLKIEPSRKVIFPLKLFIYDNKEKFFISLFLIISIISSVLSAKVVFNCTGLSNFKFAGLGLLNYLSIAILTAGAFIFKMDRTMVGSEIKNIADGSAASGVHCENISLNTFNLRLFLLAAGIVLAVLLGLKNKEEIIYVSILVIVISASFVESYLSKIINNKADENDVNKKTWMMDSFAIRFSASIVLVCFLSMFIFVTGSGELFKISDGPLSILSAIFFYFAAIFIYSAFFAFIYDSIQERSPAIASYVAIFSSFFIILVALSRVVLLYI